MIEVKLPEVTDLDLLLEALNFARKRAFSEKERNDYNYLFTQLVLNNAEVLR